LGYNCSETGAGKSRREAAKTAASDLVEGRRPFGFRPPAAALSRIRRGESGGTRLYRG